jgi:2-polyprenyl-6-methoxyphenol hydroxylase-like FAD-dependent oxidoreductase
MHVIIVGGGVGGLCLAHGLQESGISMSVHERDASANVRRQGYRISLNTHGARALKACLPGHLFQLVVATSSKPLSGRLVAFDPRLVEIMVRPLPSPADEPSYGWSDPARPFTAVNRLTLREILFSGLDEALRFGALLTSYASERDRLRALFSDGRSAVGDVLVGADGTNSPTRRQLLPNARVLEIGRAIYGKTVIRSDVLDWVPDDFVNGFATVVDGDGVSLGVGAFRKRTSFADAAAKYAPWLTLTDVPDYLMWTVSLRDEHGLRYLENKASAVLHDTAMDLVKGWHPAVRRLIQEADVDSTFLVPLRSADPVPPWTPSAVTLLGDAIHTMSPGRGVGANTALRDAELLRRRVAGAMGHGRSGIIAAIGDYEEEMCRYGFDAVAASLSSPIFQLRRP